LKSHNKVKKFECETCGKLLRKKSDLESHILLHTKEKPFECKFPYCERTFSQKVNMITHLKSHVRNFILFPFSYTNFSFPQILI
jgi:uncharacterized Zn-finger protein